tara:strand:+ start:121 stop:390 length:270 start_codon:yes stop_codon:yes gene_type:complete
VVIIKSNELVITKIKALFGVIEPFGISLIVEVLLLALSMFLSIYLLKAIAADRAKIIQHMICSSVIHSKLYNFVAKKKPIKAKGIANIV